MTKYIKELWIHLVFWIFINDQLRNFWQVVAADDRGLQPVPNYYLAAYSSRNGEGCPTGCSTCSGFNGCITCQEEFFLYLHRSGMRQIGICMHICPSGYFGVRSVGTIDRCLRCRVNNCDSCFTRNYCTRCRYGHFLYKGKCHRTCPEGYYGNEQARECHDIIHCQVSEWSSWGFCERDGKICGHKWASQTRTRDILSSPSLGGDPCPATSETQQCLMNPRFCSDDDIHWNLSDLITDAKKSGDKSMNKKNEAKNSQSKKNKRKGQKKRRRMREKFEMYNGDEFGHSSLGEDRLWRKDFKNKTPKQELWEQTEWEKQENLQIKILEP